MSTTLLLAHQAPYPTGERLIRIREVIHMTGLGRSTIYRKMKQGSFPEAVHVGTRFTAWTLSSIVAWLQSAIAGNNI